MKLISLYSYELVPMIWQGCASALHENQIKIWKKAIELGSNAFDTAEAYDNGTSETLLGKLINEVNRSSVFISTKVSSENLSKLKMKESCENSLKRLGTDYIDMYHIHWTNPNVPIDETIDTMIELIREGKIRYIGVSNFMVSQVEKFMYYLGNNSLAAVQMEYNLMNRKCESKLIPFCNKNKILFQAYTPLNFGKINNELLNNLSKKYNRSPSSIALNWITNYNSICALPKTNNTEHLIDNCNSLDFDLDGEDIININDEFIYETTMIKCNEITPMSAGGEYSNQVYKTLEEAFENKINYTPSPYDLSLEVFNSKELSKPVHIKIIEGKYFLVGGNVRYWAWVIAFGIESEIECLILK